MAFDFPNSPTIGQVFQGWIWDGEKWDSNAPSIPGPATAPPIIDGTATVGTSVKYAREDHVHPSDAAAQAVRYDVAQALTAPQQVQARQNINAMPPLRGYISGYVLTWNSTTSITVSDGVATDSTYATSMRNANAVTKGTGAWAAGNAGGLDTGAFAANKTYHWFAIYNPTTGVTDALFSLSPTAPTLPGGYTLFRRIASIMTDAGAATWQKFVQDGDYFIWDTPYSQTFTNPGATLFAMVLSGIPTGVRVEARVFIGVLANTASDQAISVYATQTSLSDLTPNVTTYATMAAYVAGYASAVSLGAMNFIMTTTTSTIRARLQVSSTNTFFYYATHGWRDSRGKD